MKKKMRIFAMIFATVLLLSLTAFAVSFEHTADALFELGLFKGTDKGYELDREATRAEAAAMLVRFLGAEEEALSLTWNVPFEDVDDWAKPYVQYLMEKGLTNGTSLTTFGSRDKCTAQQYVTFLLRALGYSDRIGGDFTYAKAIEFSTEKGLWDDSLFYEDSFWREDMCALSYVALSLSPKSGERDLLTKLEDSGAIKDAKGYDKLFEDYRAYGEAMKPLTESSAYSYTGRSVSEVTFGAEKTVTTVDVSVAIDINKVEPDKSRLILERLTDINGNKSTENYYYKDGIMYLSDGTEKLASREDFETLLQFIGVTANSKLESIAKIKSITIEDKADRTRVFTVETIGDTTTVNVKNGAPVSCSFDVDESIEYDSFSSAIKHTTELENMKFGEDVVFNFPKDLSSYADPSDVGKTDAEAIEKAVTENKDEIRKQAAETFYDLFINLIAVGHAEDFTDAEIAALEAKCNEAVDVVLADFEVRFIKVSSIVSDTAIAEITITLKDADVFFTEEVIPPMIERVKKSKEPAAKSYLTMYDELISEIEKAPSVSVEASFILEKKDGVWQPAE